MALPTIVCLKSDFNSKYLRYRHDRAQTHGLLQFAGENVMDPYAQFDVEKAKTAPDLVHIKSRYTNKYLVRWSPAHYWITASGYAPEEDKTRWDCTLFKPIFLESGQTKTMRLLHVQLGHYVSLSDNPHPFDLCLFAGSSSPSPRDLLTVVDWGLVFRLPRYVAFKGTNGKYLGTYEFNERPYLQFAYDNPDDPEARHEIFPCDPAGTICIKSTYFGKFWRLADDDWIWADAEDPRGTTQTETMFRPSFLDINVVALLNMKTTLYCKRLTTNVKDCLNASATSIDRFALLEVTNLTGEAPK